ncbi:type III-A CRISPR-associated RAMP protein Csm4 [Desulfotruncus alcoholivorax]|uniref:type III-A CRISPR-associated RAMP protein Csm4 n=1 Tax=Desulfotruncus alcoholivorax TaxID=265477 RepID=UPI0004275236|nr:hypothetical protein [Desulfotruncus alcoholivorax]
METYRIKLRLNSGFITPFQADTIFGGLCWAMRYKEGANALKAMLADFCSGKPWFIISNAFPGELLPKPVIKVKNAAPETRAEQLMLAREGKRLKKINYLTPQEFLGLIKGNKVTIEEKNDPFIRIAGIQNQLNRITGTTTEGGRLFEEEVSYVGFAEPILISIKTL